MADTWALRNANGLGGAPEWVRLPDGLAPRRGHAVAHDPAGSRLIVFGGTDGGSASADVHALHLGATPFWESLTVSGAGPAPRLGASAVFDGPRSRLVVFGGQATDGSRLGDTWVLSGMAAGSPSWAVIETEGLAPAPRSGHRAAFDSTSGRMLIFGGDTGSLAANDVWFLTTIEGTPSWTRTSPAGVRPARRSVPVFGYSPLAARAVMAMGRGASDVLGDVWVLHDPIGALPKVASEQTGAAFPTTTPDTGATYLWRVVARDAKGAQAGSAVFAFTPNGGPTVSAGPDRTITLPPGTVLLDGSASDDGLPLPLTLAWTQVSGPAEATFATPEAEDTAVAFTEVGSYLLRLTASDGAQTAADTLVVTVVPANAPPDVDAGPDLSIALDQTATLDGAAGDDGLPQGSTLVIQWSKLSGPGTVTFADAASADTTATFSEPGRYDLRLSATDGALSDEDVAVVDVGQNNLPPVANAGPDKSTALPVNSVALDGTVSDDGFPAGAVLTASWEVVSGPGLVGFANAAAAATTATFSASGTYVLRLTASDSVLSHSDEMTVVVTAPNNPPNVDAGADRALVPDAEFFKGKILVNHDEWTFTSAGFQNALDTDRFLRNVTRWFAGGRPGRFLAYSSNFSYTNPEIAAAMAAAGHSWTVSTTLPFTVATLNQYDGVFLALGPTVNNQVLIDYVRQGGNVYLGAGTGALGPAGEAAAWNTFLGAFGFRYDGTNYNGVGGVLPVASAHALLTGVESLYYNNGNTVIELNPADPRTSIIEVLVRNGQPLGLIGIYDPSGAGVVGATLEGVVTDDGRPEGGTLTSTWTQVSGPAGVTFSNPNLPTAVATFPGPGQYTLRLTASDSLQSAFDEVTFTIAPANEPPVVNAGPDRAVTLPNRALLTGSVTDDGRPLTCPLRATWTKVSGPGAVTFLERDSPETEVGFSAAGTYVVRLAASDCVAAHRDEVTVIVTASPGTNTAPTVELGDPITLTFPEHIRFFNPVVTDDGRPGGVLRGTWVVTGGPAGAVRIMDPDALATNIEFLATGTYTVRLTVTDTVLQGTDTVTVIVRTSSTVNAPPVVDAGADRTASLAAEQLQNGSGEDALVDGQVPGWTPTAEPWMRVEGDGTALPLPFAGTAYLQPPDVASGELRQDIDLGALADLPVAPVVQFRAFVRSGGESPADQARVIVEFRDDANAHVVTAFDSGAVATTGYWTAVRDARGLPPGARWVRVRLIGTRRSVPSNDAYFDAVSLRVVSHATAALNGSVTDDGLPAGTLLDITWEKLTGPGSVFFADFRSPQTTALFTSPGEYVLRLTGKDTQFTRTDDVLVTVDAANQWPRVVLGPSRTVRLPAGILDVGASVQDDGLPVGGTPTFLWTQLEGTAPVVFDSPTQGGTRMHFTTEGEYRVRLEVSDSELSEVADLAVTATTEPAGNEAPIVFAEPDHQFALAPGEAPVSATVTDDGLPAGSALSLSWAKVSGPGAVSFTNPGAANTTAHFTLPGEYVLRLTAQDGELSGSDEIAVTAETNNAPVVNAGADRTITTATTVLPGTATDDGLPRGGALTVTWSKVSGPGDVVFANPAAASTTATFNANGVHILRLTANDGDKTKTDDVAISVQRVNQAPVVNAGADQTLTTTTGTLAGSVTDDGLPAGAAVTARWTQVSGPRPATFVDASSPTSGVSFTTAGTYVFRLTATDTKLQAFDDVTLAVNAGNRPPVVNAGSDRSIDAPATTATLNGSVTDDGLPEGAALTVDWTKVSGPGAVAFAQPRSATTGVSVDAPGTYVLRLTANDSDLSASDDVTLTLNPEPENGAAPFVQLVSPADRGFVEQPTDVVGTVRSTSLLAWTLEVRREGDESFLRLAGGTTPLEASVLAPFDPTTRLNGLYELRLTATDTSGRRAMANRFIVVRHNFKVGNFSVSFLDLEVPVSGFPMRVTRTYDSRDKGKGDFGFGWRLDVSNVKVSDNETMGLQWLGTRSLGVLPSFCLQPKRPLVVTLTFQDGRTWEYEPVLTPQCQAIAPPDEVSISYRPVPGSMALGTLHPVGDNTALVIGTFPENFNLPPTPVNLLGWDFDAFDPSQYRLVLPDGTETTIDQVKGVQSIRDPNGNVITVGPGGITHSSGKGIVFKRDAQGRVESIIDPNGNAMTYRYDANGDLVAYVDREQNTTKFTYHPFVAHHLETIVDPLGRQAIRNLYDDSGRLIGHIDADGKKIEYGHQIGARREEVKDRLGNSRIFEYDTRGNVVKEIDPEGNQILRTFDARNNRLTQTVPHRPENEATARKTAYTYDARDNVLSVADPEGNTTAQTYDSSNRVLTAKDARGKVLSSEYDAKGNLTKSVDTAGNATFFTYDAAGNVLTQTQMFNGVPVLTSFRYSGANLIEEKDPLGHVTSYTYDGMGNRLTQTTTRTAPGGVVEALVTRHKYDRNGRLIETTDADGTVTKTVYDAVGQRIETHGKRPGQKIAYAYDVAGRLTKAAYPDGTVEESVFDAEGRRLSSKDRGGRVTRYEYDKSGRLTKTTFPAPDGQPAPFALNRYDDAGRLAETVDARGKSTFYEYDDAGRRTKARAPIGEGAFATSEFTYDPNGNQKTFIDANGQMFTYVYDDMNRRTRTELPDGTFTETGYDTLGRRVSERDQAGRTTRFEYDQLGRLTKVVDPQNGEAAPTTYTYDDLGNRLAQTDANGRTTHFEYDKLGRLTARVLPDGKREVMTHDVAGNVATRTDFMGRTTTYEYDIVNRLITRSYPDSTQNVSFDYFPSGARRIVTDARGVTSYAYDEQGRVTTMTYPDGRRLEYGWDANGNRTILTAVAGAREWTTQYAYDDGSRLKDAIDPLGRPSTYGYDLNGNRTSLIQPNGTSTTYAYNSLNRLTSLSTTGATGIVQSYVLTLGPAGNRERIEEHGGVVRSYGYDDLYRLKVEDVTIAGAIFYGKAFTYDPVGNRLNQTTVGAGAGMVDYAYDQRDRLLTEGPQAYTWDDNGNLTAKSGESTHTWDVENRLIRSVKGGVVTEHAYDADGNRVRTTVTPATGPPIITDYLVDTSGALSQVVVETDALGNPVATYVRGGDDLLSVIREIGSTTESRWYHADGLGSIRALTDEAGQVTDTYSYSAFGELLQHTGADPQPYAFAGEPYDPNSGFQYHRARWMDPRTGRFVGMDPWLGNPFEPSSLHRYTYAGNDPVNMVDPTGLEMSLGGQMVVGTIISVLAGAVIGGIRGGAVGAAEGAAAGLILGPIATLAMAGAGALIALIFGVSAAAGTAIASAGVGIFSGYSAIKEFINARTARERLAAGLTIALLLAPFALAARASSAQQVQGIRIQLRYKPGWTAEQIAAADAKVAALNQAASAGRATKTVPMRSGTSASARYRQACGAVPTSCDIDHILDLQLGGDDVLANMSPLDSSVNRSLGSQIYHALKDLNIGTMITEVVIGP
jgi:RHS repeat-associated protein